MRVSRIRLRNWKNFSVVDEPLGLRAFLIGPNASGKSNFLDAFRFVKDVAVDGIQAAVESRGGVSAIRCLSARQNNRVEIGMTLSEDEGNVWDYKLVFLQDNNQRPVVETEVVIRNSETVLERPNLDDKRDRERLTQTALEQTSANQRFRDISFFFKSISYLHLIPQAVRDPAGFSPRPVLDDSFGRDFLLRIWSTHQRTQGARLRNIAKALKAAVPELESLEAEMDKSGRPHLVATYSNWRARGAKQRENQFSDGTLRLLGILWSTFEGTGPLLLEEPELSLHPDVVRRLPSLFHQINRLRKEAPRQLIVSTHSPDLLQDPGIGSEEVLLLEPGPQGTRIGRASLSDQKSIEAGLTAADVFVPRTRPRSIDQLTLAF
jgi:predicted ATPase